MSPTAQENDGTKAPGTAPDEPGIEAVTPGAAPAEAAAPSPASATVPSVGARAAHAAVYGLSLPERVARAMVGAASSVVRETAQFAVPDAFKGGRFYHITVKKMLGFLADDFGKLHTPEEAAAQAEAERAAEPAAHGEHFVVKKAIGNAIDVAGLAVLHVSPIWVTAIFSDVVYGTKTYFNRLVEELREEGVLSESETIEGVDQLLDALQNASGSLADNLDTPPVTVKQLRATVTTLREQADKVDLTKLISVEDLARVWHSIEETVRVEKRSLFEVSNAVAMMTYTQIVRAGKGAVGTVKVALDLLSDNVVEYYFQAFLRIQEKGYYVSVMETFEHFVGDLGHLFQPSAETATERLLRGRWLLRWWRGLWSWARRRFGRRT